jgi:aspartyl-tRNA(Asn)/glutamyl-tRNA(Gln) amidotransferase subunit C
MNSEEIKKLGFLARMEVSDEDAEVFADDIANILEYVKQVEEVDTHDIEVSFALKNVMREDDNPYESGIFTEDILAQAPDTENGFIKVKKIL